MYRLYNPNNSLNIIQPKELIIIIQVFDKLVFFVLVY